MSTPPDEFGATMSRAVAVLLVALLALTGCAAAPAQGPAPTATSTSKPVPAARTVSGFVNVAATNDQFETFAAAGELDPLNRSYDCVSSASYADVAEGAQIIATDASGDVVAIGTLEAGQYEFESDKMVCQFSFNIEDIVLDKKFYGLSVGNVFRGDVQFSEEDMRVGPRLYLG